MHPHALRRPPLCDTRAPWRRWVLWLLVQALAALALSSGPRAVAGPLHVHVGGGSHAHAGVEGATLGRHDEARRHHHAQDAGGIVWLEQAAQAAEDATASAVSTLWPALPAGPMVPEGPRAGWWRAGACESWVDADPLPREHRPRA